MHTVTLIILIPLITLQSTACATDLAYQWSDAQGQVNFGDKPPLAQEARAITLESNPYTGNRSQGLRPGERALLGTIERRRQQQLTRSHNARSRADKQRAMLRKQCRNHRVRLKLAEGRDGFKRHARFLRSNCW